MSVRKFVPTRQPDPVLGTTALSISTDSTFAIANRINDGLPVDAVQSLARSLDATIEQVLEFTRISSSTYHNRKRNNQPLSPEESSRLYCIARIAEAALDYFDEEKVAAKRWLEGKKVGLGGKSPLEFARTPQGSDYVVSLLSRMAHGVIS